MRTAILSLLALFALVLASPARADVSPAPDSYKQCDCPHAKAGATCKDCPKHKAGKCDCPHAKKGAKCDCAKCKDCPNHKGGKCNCPHHKAGKAGAKCDCPKCKAGKPCDCAKCKQHKK